MAIAFDAMVTVESNGLVKWSFSSGSSAEACGLGRIDRRGTVGRGGPDDGSDDRAHDVLTALESLATVMLAASRTLTPTRQMFTAAGDLIDDGSIA